MTRLPARSCALSLGLLFGIVLTAGPVGAQETCEERPGYDRLDFWLGEWDVFSGEQQVGSNRISKVLDGCAVMEEWEGAGGGEGRSLFYYDARSDGWKQVWVTSTSFRVGGVKEKTLVETLDDGGVRFQGHVSDDSGQEWIDRTTLRPVPDGRVRQVIEVSSDGASWQTVFDAVYIQVGEPSGGSDAGW